MNPPDIRVEAIARAKLVPGPNGTFFSAFIAPVTFEKVMHFHQDLEEAADFGANVPKLIAFSWEGTQH